MFIDGLNEPQAQATQHTGGALLVIAGAGSGKTRVITARMAYLITHHKVSPSSIIALTFTNKAAQEMKERLVAMLSKEHGLPFVGTFHAYCLYLLRRNPHYAPFEHFSILDEEDCATIIKKIIKKHGLEKQISPNHAKHYISSIKNSLSLSGPHQANPYSQNLLIELHAAYEEEKRANHALDFDDLLVEVLSIFKKSPTFQTTFQENIRHILIDEYQDTNALQHELLKQMAQGASGLALDSLCVVGDEDQSIYSWRGAVVANMLTFKSDFAPVTLIKIEQNYRSVEPILQAANHVISHNEQRNEKKLWSTKKGTNRILSLVCRSEYQEAEAIALFAQSFFKTHQNQSLAVLYRTHMQSRTIEEALIHANLPYRIIGGIQFYQRKEVKDLLAYLRLVVNPYDKVSFFRILNTPPRGLGEKTEEQLAQYWSEQQNISFHEVIEHFCTQDNNAIPLKKRELLQTLLSFYRSASKEDKASTLLRHVIDETDYLSYIHENHEPDDAKTKLGIVQEFVDAAHYFESAQGTIFEIGSTNPSLEHFLFNIALMQEKSDRTAPDANPILLMTLHAAKGLEFNTVILPGLEEELFPSYNALQNSANLEEERRLFYVGITRACERLLLSHAERRSVYGQTKHQEISRFLREVPSSLLTPLNITTSSQSTLQHTFNAWLGGKMTTSTTFFGGRALENEQPFQAKQPTAHATSSPWRLNRPVIHQKFGVGIIKKIERKSDTEHYLTIAFKSGEKKLLSTFVSPI